VDGSRRFWGILLYRYLSKCLIAAREGGPQGAAPDRIPNDELVLGTRLGDEGRESGGVASGRGRARIGNVLRRDAFYLPGEAFTRAGTAYRLRGSFASSRSIVTGFHGFDVISRLVASPASLLAPRVGRGDRTADKALRDRLAEMAEDIDWPLARVALEWMPSWYVEEFRALHRSVEVVDASEKEFHAACLPTIEARMTVARYVEEGSRLSLYQHAAMYGEVRGHVLYHAESALADRFRTWGWKLRENDEPFLALRLMKPPRLMFRTKHGAADWLYVIVRQPLPEFIKRTFAVQQRFFAGLSDDRAARVVVRPRTNKGGLGERQVIDEARPRLRAIDDGASRMVDLVADAELVVLDMFPSTAFMECITGGVPVVAIVPEDTAFTESAARYYDEFARIGLLHQSPESAAAFLNHLSVRSWWSDVSALDCFQDYLNVFCNRDPSRIGGQPTGVGLATVVMQAQSRKPTG
jgi:putative transferase (TIGR04331 family)